MRWGSERYAQLIKVCRARGCSREDASDLVQEAHLRLFEYLRSAKVKDVNALLRRIVINLSINLYHRERSSPLVSESLGRLDRRGLLIDPAAGPERALAAEQQLDRVVGLLSAVSPRSCQIFIAQRGGYTYEEIGSAYAIKPRTVEKHVTSAMLALKEMMPAEFAIP
jgi:RNA polymerase sigma factor (sigma-70 family)